MFMMLYEKRYMTGVSVADTDTARTEIHLYLAFIVFNYELSNWLASVYFY